MSLVKQLAPRWKLNAVILWANAPLSVLLPVKNGSDKIPAVSIALEIWIALNGGKQTVLLPCFLQIASKIIQRGLMELGHLLAQFLFCISGAPIRAPHHPCSTSGEPWRGKKSLGPRSRGVNWTSWTWHLPCFTAKQWIFTKLLCLSGCQWTWCSAVGEQVPGDRREVGNHLDLGGDSLWPILSPFLPIWGLPASQPGSQTPLLPGLLFYIAHSCHPLDPVHIETTRKSRSSVPSQLKVCSANEAWLPSEKFSSSTELWLGFWEQN